MPTCKTASVVLLYSQGKDLKKKPEKERLNDVRYQEHRIMTLDGKVEGHYFFAFWKTPFPSPVATSIRSGPISFCGPSVSLSYTVNTSATKSPDSIKAAGVFHFIMPFGVRSSAGLRFLLCGEHGRTMEYWMSFEDGPGSHRGKGAVLHRVNPYDQPPKGGSFLII